MQNVLGSVADVSKQRRSDTLAASNIRDGQSASRPTSRKSVKSPDAFAEENSIESFVESYATTAIHGRIAAFGHSQTNSSTKKSLG